MTVKINADTTNGAVITSDTSGEIELQAGGTKIATVKSTGIEMATGKTIPSSALTGALPALDGSSLTGLGQTFTGWDVWRNTAFNLTGNVWTKIVWNATNYKTSDITFDSAGKITPTKAGYYLFNTEFNANNNTNSRTALYKNGSAYRYGHNTGANPYHGGHLAIIAYANGSTDYFEIYNWTNSTVALEVQANTTNTFQGAYLGA